MRPPRYTARHARRSTVPARVAVTTLLAGVVPLGLPTGPAAAAGRSDTTVRLSAPATTGPGRVPVSVRLRDEGGAVHHGVVDVQISEGTGWRTVRRVPTDAAGIGRATLRLAGDTRVRAYYRGSVSRQPDASPSRTVDVRRRALSALRASGSGLLAEAARHVGKPYVYGASGPSAFDCSGFTQYVFSKAGKALPHNARAQERVATRVSKNAARPGDLVFIQDVAGHVGIYAGGGRMYDSPRSGKSVSLRRIWTSHYTVGRV
ncbi:MAG: NlpC/P60 family protein [Actinomycetota bacterium]|nr:NlpC/P60 family protein [Actinomycetota bacterium]